MRADRDDPDAFQAVRQTNWDAVVDISSDPQRVRIDGRAQLRTKNAALSRISLLPACMRTTPRPTRTNPRRRSSRLSTARRTIPNCTAHYKVAYENCRGDEVRKRTHDDFSRRFGRRSRRSVGSKWILAVTICLAGRRTPGRVLVPNEPDLATQLVDFDAADLAAFVLLACARERIAGTQFNALGESISLAKHFCARAARCRVCGHDGRGGFLVARRARRCLLDGTEIASAVVAASGLRRLRNARYLGGTQRRPLVTSDARNARRHVGVGKNARCRAAARRTIG